MITKGIIYTIDYASNKCSVRIPTFETASCPGVPAIFNAIFMDMPGIYNGYKVDDIVFVAFEEGNISYPVVIGKLYLGANVEDNYRGVVSCDNLSVKSGASIPITTKLTSGDSLEESLTNSSKTFNTIKDIADLLQEQSTTLDKLTSTNNTTFYSSGEVVIGNWIDNKPIYRKTYIITPSPAIVQGNTFERSFSIAALNYDNIWIDQTHTIQIGSTYSVNPYYTTNDYFNCFINTSTKNAYYRGKAPDNIVKFIITLEYTKN